MILLQLLNEEEIKSHLLKNFFHKLIPKSFPTTLYVIEKN